MSNQIPGKEAELKKVAHWDMLFVPPRVFSPIGKKIFFLQQQNISLGWYAIKTFLL
jgi:hypothetical protein